ncbi:transposase [Microbacterium sp. C448]|nr:transposase [Microbacterium sp. C448]
MLSTAISQNGRMADTTFEEAAEALYGLAPADFIAARKTLAAAAPDRETAAQIRGLRKPATSVWVVNLLSRRAANEVGRLSTLAAEMREAQEDRDAARLTSLNKERRTLVAELVRTATTLANDEGIDLGAGIVAEVERTLGAAARDEAAASAVRTGRLLRPLEASGVDPVDLTDAVAGEAPVAAEPVAVRGRDDLAERRARRDAERAAAVVRREAADAERESARAEARLATAREREALLRERVDALESEIARIRADADAATAERNDAESARDVSAERLRTANRAAARLTGPS